MNKTISILSLIVLLALTSCQGSPATNHTPVPELSPATQLPPTQPSELSMAPSFPVGIFTCLKNEPHKHTLAFLADGRYKYQALTAYDAPENLELKLRLGPDNVQVTTAVASGTYSVSGNQVTFTPTTPQDKLPCTDPGAYTWAYDGEELSLMPLDDPCAAREYLLTTGSWVVQP